MPKPTADSSSADAPRVPFPHFLVALAPDAGLVILRQTFVRRCHQGERGSEAQEMTAASRAYLS